MASLAEVLSQNPGSFSFMQAMRLIASVVGHPPLEPSYPLRLRASHSTAFPASDIAAADYSGGVHRLELSFMGLSGASSPIPNYLVALAQHPDNGPAFSAFLAIVERRLYLLLYEAWERACSRDLVSVLSGSNTPGAPSHCALRAHPGVWLAAPRSARAVAMAVGAALALPVRIEQNVTRRTALPARHGLGQDLCLGDNTALGEHYLDTHHFFRVVIGPVTACQARAMQPGSTLRSLTERMVRWLIHAPLWFDIRLELASSEYRPAVLGATSTLVGFGATLGHTPSHHMATGP